VEETIDVLFKGAEVVFESLDVKLWDIHTRNRFFKSTSNIVGGNFGQGSVISVLVGG